MSRQVQPDGRTWKSHPVRAWLIRAAAFLIPLVFSIVVGLGVGSVLPTPVSLLGFVLWWLVVLVSSTLALFGADRLTRRLLPLATLMRLSMLFPDRAPSRVKLARRVSGSKAIAAELDRAGRAGRKGDRQQVAETILALVGALGDYDSRTRGHSERTQLFVTLLADELKLGKEDKGRLMWAALVHDIGKLKVPHDVLNKPGRPTEEEWATLHSHPEHGAEICEPLRQWLGPWWLAIEQHHEKYDGSGYPRGLAGTEISYGARIVAVADSYEVMTAARPYKRPMTAAAAREELTRCAGTQFDPEVVRAFLSISLGRIHRSAGPIAWITQILMVRPGPLLGQIMGGAAGAAAAAAGVVGLGLAPSAQATPPPEERAAAPRVQTTPTPTPAPTPSAEPSRKPVRPAAPSAPATDEPRPAARPAAVPSTEFTLTPAPTPVAMSLSDDVLTTPEDTPAEVDVLANDTAGDGGTLSFASVGSAGNGSVARTEDSTLRYVPAADFSGSDSFTYTVLDGTGGTSTATVNVKVDPVNDAPLAVADALTLDEDSVEVLWDPAANDVDPDGDRLSVVSVTGAVNGTLRRATDGRWGYTPAREYSGSETLFYTVVDGSGASDIGSVLVTVRSVNDAPVAVDDARTLPEDSAEVVWDLAANDTDVEGDPLTVVSVTGAVRGTLAPAAGGLWGYTPDPDFFGSETLTYTVSDGNGGSGTGTVRVTVTGVNDAPVAVDDTRTLPEDSPGVVWDLAANDSDVDGDALSVVSVTGAANGTVTPAAGGLWRYTPDPDFFGTETLTYRVEDPSGAADNGQVTVTVTSVNDAPVAVADTVSLLEDAIDVALPLAANDTDTEGDALSVTSVTGALNGTVTEQSPGTWTYTPDGEWNGSEVLTYTVSDGNGGTDTGSVDVTVISVNDAPVTGPDAFATTFPGTLSVNAANGVLANDSDVDGDAITVIGDDSADVVIAPDGSFSYIVPAVITEVVTYTVSDGTLTATGTLTITATGAPSTQTKFRLEGGSTTANTPLTLGWSPSSGPVSDWDSDGIEGLTIDDGGTKFSETEHDKFQVWQYAVPAGGLTLNGPITLDLWTRLEKDAPNDLDYSAWVYHCAADGTGCVFLGSTVDLHVDDWSSVDTWEKRTLTLGSADTTIAAGRVLRLRLGFDHSEVYLPLGGGYDSTLNLTG